jgi:A/G-specific adenine glycosylase
MILARNARGEILVERRPPAGIWGGLWSLPETAPGTNLAVWCGERLGCVPLRVEMLPTRRHTFSHFALEIHIAEIRLAGPQLGIADACQEQWASAAAIGEMGLPAPVRSIIQASNHTPPTDHPISQSEEAVR